MPKSKRDSGNIHKESKAPAPFHGAFYAVLFSLVVLFVFTHTIGLLYEKIEKLFPNSNKIEDFQLSDLAFAHGQARVGTDTSIVIVNSSADNRIALAEKIKKIDSFGPAAIGVDIKFVGRKKDEDSALKAIINEINVKKNNIVLCVSRKDDSGVPTFDTEFYQDLQNERKANTSYNWGFLAEQGTNETWREFEPYPGEHDDGHLDSSFEVKLLRIACGSDSFALLNKDNEKWGIINFRKPLEGYNCRYNTYDAVPDSIAAFKGKIVLVGLYDTTLVADRHYTPFSGSLGRQLPDMFGVEYHAQVMSMILKRDFVGKVPWLALWVDLCCLGFMSLFISIYRKSAKLYHYFVDIIMVIIVTPLFIMISFLFLDQFHTKLEPVDFIIPIFACGFLWHLYEWFLERKFFRRIQKYFTADSPHESNSFSKSKQQMIMNEKNA